MGYCAPSSPVYLHSHVGVGISQGTAQCPGTITNAQISPFIGVLLFSLERVSVRQA